MGYDMYWIRVDDTEPAEKRLRKDRS